jgi:hypothetical protein
LTLLFLISLGVMVIGYVQALPSGSTPIPGTTNEVLVAAAALLSGTPCGPRTPLAADK